MCCSTRRSLLASSMLLIISLYFSCAVSLSLSFILIVPRVYVSTFKEKMKIITFKSAPEKWNRVYAPRYALKKLIIFWKQMLNWNNPISMITEVLISLLSYRTFHGPAMYDDKPTILCKLYKGTTSEKISHQLLACFLNYAFMYSGFLFKPGLSWACYHILWLIIYTHLQHKTMVKLQTGPSLLGITFHLQFQYLCTD